MLGTGSKTTERFAGAGSYNQPSKGFAASTLGDEDETRVLSDPGEFPSEDVDEQEQEDRQKDDEDDDEEYQDADGQVREQLQHQHQQPGMPMPVRRAASPKKGGLFELRDENRNPNQQPSSSYNRDDLMQQAAAENFELPGSDDEMEYDEEEEQQAHQQQQRLTREELLRQRDEGYAELHGPAMRKQAFLAGQQEQARQRYQQTAHHDPYAATELGDDTMQVDLGASSPAQELVPEPARGRGDLRTQFQQPAKGFAALPTVQRGRERSGSVVYDPQPASQLPQYRSQATPAPQYASQQPSYQQHESRQQVPVQVYVQPQPMQTPVVPMHRPQPPQQQQQRKRAASPAPVSEYDYDAEAPNSGQKESQQMRVESTEPDYDLPTLYQKPYSELASQPFDTLPNAVSTQNPKKKGTLSERLAKTAAQPADAQKAFLNGLPLNEWEEAGDWFAGEFSKLMGRYVELRRERRVTAESFEKKLAQRDEVVQRKVGKVEEDLNEMKRGGMALLRQQTP